MSIVEDIILDIPPLRRSVLIRYQWGEQKFEIVCTACSLREYTWEETGQRLTWLLCKGMQTAEVNWENPVHLMNLLIPANYVTGIQPGPTFVLAKPESHGRPGIGLFPPIHPPPPGALLFAEIERVLVEQLDPTQN